MVSETRYDGDEDDNDRTVDVSTENESSSKRKSRGHPADIVEGRRTETAEEKEEEKVADVVAVEEVQRPTSDYALIMAPPDSIQHDEHVGRSRSDEDGTHHLGYVQQNAGYSLDVVPPPPLPQYQHPHPHGQMLPSVQGITIGVGDRDVYSFRKLMERLRTQNLELAMLRQEVVFLNHSLEEERFNVTELACKLDCVTQALHNEVARKYQADTHARRLKHASASSCLACGRGGSHAGKGGNSMNGDDDINDDDDDDVGNNDDDDDKNDDDDDDEKDDDDENGVKNAPRNFRVRAPPPSGSRLREEESGGREFMALPSAAAQSVAAYAASNGVHGGYDATSHANPRTCTTKQFSSDQFDTFVDYYGRNDRRSNEEKTHLISPSSFGTGVGSQNSKHLPTNSIVKPTPYENGSSTAKHDDDQARVGGQSQKITHFCQAATAIPQWQYVANYHYPSINPRGMGSIPLSSFVDTHWGENGVKLAETLKLIGFMIDPSPGSQTSGTISDMSWEYGDLSAANRSREEQIKVVDEVLPGCRGKYTGNVLVSTGLPHGKGRMEYAAVGKTYYGHWRNGQRDGFGEATYSNGDTFEGFHLADQHHGKGIYKWKNGSSYKGEFDHHIRHGKGTLSRHNGTEYNGDFINGKEDGHGICMYADGRRYHGGWAEGRYNGDGTLTWPDGRSYSGGWRRGLKHGTGTESFADGSNPREGLWSNDEYVY